MSAANRNRGARAEVQVVNFLRSQGWEDARRYLAGDGRQPGDVDWHPLICLEVKDVAASSWPTWCRQAASEARPGMVPVVVRRVRGVPDVGAWPIRLPWSGVAWWLPPGPTVTHDVPECRPWFWWAESTMGELVAAVKAVDA